MKRRVWSGIAALMLLAACGGGTAETTETAATTAATTVAVEPTVVPTTETLESPTAEATMEMETPTTEATMEMMESPTAMMEMTAEATMEMDDTAEATSEADDDSTEATSEADDDTAAGDPGDPAARQAILDAFSNQMTGGPFRSDTTIETSGQTYTVQGEYIPPRRVNVTSTIGGQTTQIIIVEDQMWQKVGDTWTEVPGGAEQATQMLTQMATNPEESGIQINNAQSAGTEDIEGVTANVYTYDSVFENSGQTIEGNGKIWIDPSNGLPLKLESEAEVQGVSSKTTQEIEYDDSITIEPPVTE